MRFEDEETPEGTENEENTAGEEASENTEGAEVADAEGEAPEGAAPDGEAVQNQPGELEENEEETEERDLEAVYDIPVKIAAVLGHASMPVNQLLKLGRGAVVELDRRVGEAIEIYVNNLLVARGEVVIVDEKLGITMTEIIKSQN